MGGMEFNKIFAAVLVAGIVASFSGFFAKEAVHPHKLHKDAVSVEAADAGAAGAGAAAKPAGPDPVLALIAAADAEKGKKVAKACAACHSFDKGGPDSTGPNLWNIVGKAKGAKAGFAYSDALVAFGGNWDYDALNHFLWKPKKYIEGTKMNFIGVKKAQDRANLIAYLRSMADSPAALPSDAAIAAEAAANAAQDVLEGADAAASEAVDAVSDAVESAVESISDVAH